MTAPSFSELNALLPPPDLQPWYLAQRFALFGVLAGLVVLLALDVWFRKDAPSTRALLARVRLFALLFVFGAVAVWGFHTRARRSERRAWKRPLHVAVVLLEAAPLAQAVVSAFGLGAARASKFISREQLRYRGAASTPVYFHLFGPAALPGQPPAPDDEGLLSQLTHRYQLSRYLARVDERVHLRAAHYDARMYVIARPARSGQAARFVEGIGEQGGEIGIVRVDLDERMVDAAFTAIVHELLHTLGASDKFDAQGHARWPEGFAEPKKVPLFPQARAEIMVGEVPLSRFQGRLPKDFTELSIGEATAREIGFLPGSEGTATQR